MKLYNTASREVEEFKPQNPAHVKIYTCGPTVYARAHIGNLCSYVYWDLLLSALRLNDYTPYRVLNFTDVGHLTSDGDDGEDKLEKGARREKKTVWEVAEHYEELFLEDFRALGLDEPEKICKATDYIEGDLGLIDNLTRQGYTYETKEAVYFDTAKFPDYAKFARLDLDHLKAGARVEFNSKKRNVSDFALWKFIQPGEDHAMQWQYRGRKGYPGWHVECSVISHLELGETLDIHTGGIDHIPVHHTNEIAQSEAAYHLKFANYWLHCNFITINGQKVSKSLGNVYSLDDLRERGFSPLDFKMWVLQGHYQGERNFSFEDLTAAKNRRLAWTNRAFAAAQLSPDAPASPDFLKKLRAALSNNLNSAEAFALIDGSELSLADWRQVERIFRLGLLDFPEITDYQADLLKQRAAAREKKDFETADKIRDELKSQNLVVQDQNASAILQLAG